MKASDHTIVWVVWISGAVIFQVIQLLTDYKNTSLCLDSGAWLVERKSINNSFLVKLSHTVCRVIYTGMTGKVVNGCRVSLGAPCSLVELSRRFSDACHLHQAIAISQSVQTRPRTRRMGFEPQQGWLAVFSATSRPTQVHPVSYPICTGVVS